VAHEDRIEKSKIGENANRVENHAHRKSEFLKLRKFVGTHEAHEKKNKENSSDRGGAGEIENRINGKERSENKVNEEIVILPELRRFSRENECAHFDLNLTHKKCAEDHEVNRLLNQIEKIVDAAESQKIKNEAAEKYGGRNCDFMFLIEGEKPGTNRNWRRCLH
jgi:hypothetical protein